MQQGRIVQSKLHLTGLGPMVEVRVSHETDHSGYRQRQRQKQPSSK